MQMPTARHLLDQVLDDLRLGRSVFGLLPEGVDPDLLRSALWDGLGHWDLHTQEVFISQLDAQMPAAALGQALGVDWRPSNTPRTVENLLKQAGLPEVLFINGFDELAEGDRIQWLQFMVQWAQICQGRHSTDGDGPAIPPALCLIVQAAKVPYPPPPTNVLLSVRVWWGIPTALEMRMLCQLISKQYPDSAPLNRWREYVIPAIAGSDLCLGDYLWERYGTGSDLASVLQDFVQEREWTQVELGAWPINGFPRDGVYPLEDWPFYFFQAWARGIVHWTPEHGLERHSAVLAMLDQQEALNHRLWRGQAEFLLAQIDQIRLALCAHLNEAYGPAWPYKWRKPETDIECQEVKSTPFACQWGHLKYLIQNCSELHKERRWSSLVQHSWRIRTELAHYRPISLQEYEKFYRELMRSHQVGLTTTW